MRRLLLIALLVPAIAVGQSAKGEKQLVGTWKFDTKSLKVELSAEAKQQMSKAKGAPKLDELKSQLAKTIAPFVYRFSADHTFSVTAPNPKGKPLNLVGTWALKGQSISVTMKDKTPAPELTLSKDGKRINAIYKQMGFGTGSIDLVKN